MEKAPEQKQETREKKERPKLWSQLGMIALASYMAAACVNAEHRPSRSSRDHEKVTIHALAEQEMRPAGERPILQWDKEVHKDEKGYATGETLHAKIITHDKAYRVDLELGPIHPSVSMATDNPMVPKEGYPMEGAVDPSSISWYDMDSHGTGVVLKFVPVIDQKGESALQVHTTYYEHGKAVEDRDTVGKPNAEHPPRPQ
jgi:hypothetical protein